MSVRRWWGVVGTVDLLVDLSRHGDGRPMPAWHRRLVLWHLYVARARRRTGIGRALLHEVEAHGRERGARTVWLETTSMNVPGIRAYERLGYRLCGCDTTLYDTLVYADEAALYFSKPL